MQDASLDSIESLAKTVMWENVIRISTTLSFCLGVPLNALLVWTVVRHSPDELKVYRKVLVQTALIDLTFLTMCFLVQPVSHIRQ